jgi:hypothetical protein
MASRAMSNGQALDFEVELEAGDPVAGATDFEIHIPEMVFRTDDVRKDNVLGDPPH